MVKSFVPVPSTLSFPSAGAPDLPIEGPRLGHPGQPRTHATRRDTSDIRPPDTKRLRLATILAASLATAGLIWVGYMATPQMPAASPAVLQETARISSAPQAGPPLFTGSIAIEPVEVTTASLRGALFVGKGLPAAALPTDLRPTTIPPVYSTALAPTPVTGSRLQADSPRVLVAEPVRLASLAPGGPGGMLKRPAPPLEPQSQDHTFIVAPGDTLGAILGRYGLDDREELALIKALRSVFAPKDLRAGQQVTLTVIEDTANTVIPLSLTFRTDFGDVAVNRKSDGTYAGALVGGPAGTAGHHRAISRIQTSLYGAARAQKVPDTIIVRMMNTHSYDVDFQREIRPGDTFEVFYARSQSDDIRPRGRGTLLFSSLTTSGKKRSYYRFTSKDGDTDYYDENGVSSKKPLMRTPIDGARISSGFGMRRHPILGYSKMHTGTDFAAPAGTPIYAAGDGRIDFAGRNGGYGNYVRLKHDNGVKTAYAHMKRIAKGIKKGRRVRQGQVIGFVGSTGRTTGAHLHYEITINGKKRNPLKVKIAGGGRRLEGADRKAFVAEKARIDKLRQDQPATTLVAART